MKVLQSKRHAVMLLLPLAVVAFWAKAVVVEAEQPQPVSAPDVAESLPKDVLASVDRRDITVEVFAKEMIRRRGYLHAQSISKEQKAALLEELIRAEVLAAQAKKEGYDEDPEVVQRTKKLMVQKLWQDAMARRSSAAKVTDEEAHQYYERHKSQYSQPETARGAVIFFKYPPKATAADKARLQAKANEIRDQAAARAATPGAFGALAREHSDERTTRQRGGDMGWVAEGARIFKWDGALIDALFALDRVGEISPVIPTPRGLYLVKLADKKDAEPRRFSEVKHDIERYLAAQKRRQMQDDYYQSTRKDFTVKINDGLLESFDVREKAAATRARPPSFPLDTNS